MALFELKNIGCFRRDKLLFRQINFRLRDGELMQINGLNGSGKSSLMQICAGLVRAYEGEVLWNNEPIAIRRRLFQRDMRYIGHENGVKEALTAGENMRVIHALSGRAEAVDYDLILEKIGLPGTQDVLLGQMSAGQKRRIGLTRIMLSPARLWLLDEPFNTLDQDGAKIVERLITRHCRQGGMTIFTSHQTVGIDDCIVKHICLDNTSV